MDEACENIHVCTYENCDKSFTKESRLVLHTRTHTGERPFTCEFSGCCRSYTRAAHLKRHEDTAHCTATETSPEPASKHWCEIDGCESSFTSQHNLKKHVRRTHQKDTYTCHKCQAVFNKHHQLTTHRLTEHSQNLSYKCRVEGCGKSFKFSTRLRRHEKQHEGYRCDQSACDAVFDKWSLLRKHKMLQHSTGHHECRTCGKSFSQKQWLKKHLGVHRDSRETMECPYDECRREYFDLRNLRAHIHSYHECKKYECSEDGCGRSFSSKQKLQLHMRLHDPSKPPPKKKRPKKKTAAESLTGLSMGTEDRAADLDDMLSSPNTSLTDKDDLSHLTSEDIDFTKLKTKSSNKSREKSDLENSAVHTNFVDIVRKSVLCYKQDCDVKVATSESEVNIDCVSKDTNSES